MDRYVFDIYNITYRKKGDGYAFVWRPIKRFSWMNYVFLMVWRKRELYMTKRNLGK
jgi:hypothetical protein